MTITANYIKHIEKEIITMTMNSYEKNELDDAQMSEIAKIVLAATENMTLHSELTSMLQALGSKWPMFGNLVTIEKGKELEEHKQAAINDVLSLTKDGKIQDAISAAKIFTSVSNL
ncbi:hypothetical protein BH09PAT1_BH09PAT1_1260 [soil metagenome]